MDTITEHLVEAGYFRARISNLSDFDKIIGGMAWAMQVFSNDLNIDVFYTDSLDLGQKIALTERLVMVLLVMKCPYRLEPHQIVGLDYANLSPAIKWLIRRSTEVRREHEGFNRLLALRHYQRVTGTGHDRSAWCYVVPVAHLKQVKSTGKSPGSIGLAASCEDQTTARLIERINRDFKDNQQVSFVQLASLLRANRNKEANKPCWGADRFDISEAHEEDSETSDLERRLHGSRPLESDRELDLEFNRVLQTSSSSPEVTVSAEERLQHRELDQELLATNQKILNLLKKIDAMPSQLEICQYQRRYVELHQRLISKNKDLKKLYDLYNTLNVTKHYLTKEITLLDSISANLNLTTNSASNRKLFLEQFNQIIGKVNEIRADMQNRLEKLREKRDLLNSEYAQLLDGSESDGV